MQTHTATVPVLLEVNPNGGLDPLSSDSCVAANMKQFFPADHSNEIILHIQVCNIAQHALPDELHEVRLQTALFPYSV